MTRLNSQKRPLGAPAQNNAALNRDGRVVGSNRDWKLLVVFFFMALVLIVQLVNLQVFAAPELREQGEAQRIPSQVSIRAQRGTIYDRNGNVLAYDSDATTIYANPQQIDDLGATSAVLAEVLGGNAESYYQVLAEGRSEGLSFVYIKKQADTVSAQALVNKDAEFRSLNKQAGQTGQTGQTGQAAADATDDTPSSPLTGIHYLQDTKRVYPYGSIGVQVIGTVDIDNRGVCGIELMYDNLLRGTDGQLSAEYSLELPDRPLSGQPIPGSERADVAPVRGMDITISLDIELQQFLEIELARAGEAGRTSNGSALYLDGATGEIYATASLPLPSRDNLSKTAFDFDGEMTLKPIIVPYEPGSTFKTVTMAAILEEDAMRPQDEMLVSDRREYESDTIKDAYPHDDMVMSLTDILVQSSNVGMSMAKDRIGDEVFYSYLKKYSFGQSTHVDFPTEIIGSLDPYTQWEDIKSGNISFGQGVSVTSLELAGFYGAIANGGVRYQPHFLIDSEHSSASLGLKYSGTEIMRPETAATLEMMLSAVVSEGTGRSARIEAFDVAGKTGTAEKPMLDGKEKGYLVDDYILSFVGYLPHTTSKLVCIASLDNPVRETEDFPPAVLFASLMRFAANRYMIQPVSPDTTADGGQAAAAGKQSAATGGQSAAGGQATAGGQSATADAGVAIATGPQQIAYTGQDKIQGWWGALSDGAGITNQPFWVKPDGVPDDGG